MAELEDMINSVLSDPEQMDMIAGLAKSLMGGQEAPSSRQDPPSFDAAMLGKIQGLMGGGEKSRSENMLRAMQPYLSAGRREKMDKALKLAKLARLAGFAMGELGGEKDD